MIWKGRIEHKSTHRIKLKYVTEYGRRIKIKTRSGVTPKLQFLSFLGHPAYAMRCFAST